jgi:hypothetical protein
VTAFFINHFLFRKIKIMSFLEFWKSDILLNQAIETIYSEEGFKKQFNTSIEVGEEVLSYLLEKLPQVFEIQDISSEHEENWKSQIYEQVNWTDDFEDNYPDFDSLTNQLQEEGSQAAFHLSTEDSIPVYLYLPHYILENFVKIHLGKKRKLLTLSE